MHLQGRLMAHRTLERQMVPHPRYKLPVIPAGIYHRFTPGKAKVLVRGTQLFKVCRLPYLLTSDELFTTYFASIRTSQIGSRTIAIQRPMRACTMIHMRRASASLSQCWYDFNEVQPLSASMAPIFQYNHPSLMKFITRARSIYATVIWRLPKEFNLVILSS